jgi:hypothetical protein
MLYFRKLSLLLVFLVGLGLSYSQAQSKFTIKPRGKVLICKGDSIKVGAASGYTLYSWSTGQKGQYIMVSKAGQYVGYGYIGRTRFSDTLNVSYYSSKSLNLFSIPKSKEICQGDSVVIEASKGFRTYSWTDSKKGPRVVYTPKNSINIVCEAVDSNGCKYKEDISITVKNCSGCPKVLSGNPHLCDSGDSVTLEAKSGYKNYRWLNGPSGRLYSVKKSGWYYIVFQNDTVKCKDSVFVSQGRLKFEIWTKPSPPTICKGDSIKLSVPYKGFKSYWWSTGHRYNDFVFQPDTSIKVVVEAKDSNGCNYRATVFITVKDTCKKACDVIEAWPRKVICGDSDTLILEAKSGYKKYLWYDKGDGRKRSITKAGWYWVEVISQGGDTCRDSVYITKVKPVPLKLFSSPSPAVICPGQRVVLEASRGFKSYWWNTGHKNVNRVVLEGLKKTKGIVVEALDSNGCPARAVLYITVKDTCKKGCDVIEAWPKKVICGDKDTVILEAKSGYKKYLWYDKNDGRLRSITKAGWYWVEVISQYGDTCRDSIYISKVNPRELKLFTKPSPPKVCKGKKLVIEASSGFVGYWWSTRDTGSRIEIYPTTSGKVVIEAIDSNGCRVRKVLEYTVDTCTGSITQLRKAEMSIYPNPATDYTLVKVENEYSGIIHIVDYAGRVIYTEDVRGRLTQLNLSELKTGLYVVTYATKQGRTQQLLQIIKR